MAEIVDVVVIGGGVMGAAAAWALSRSATQERRALRMVLLEQFQIGHTRGSSHGGSRIFRYTHPVADEAALMPQILQLWRNLEQDSGETLLSLCGGLFIGERESDPFLSACCTVLDEQGMPYEVWDPAELGRRYKQFRLFPHEVALFQPDSGIAAASPAVAAMVRVARSRGVELREQCRVIAVEPCNGEFLVHYRHGDHAHTLQARRVILTVGPWAPPFLRALLPGWPELPLRVTHQQVAYFRVSEPQRWAVANCPIFIYTADPHVYGFPIYERPGMIKVARELQGDGIDPDHAREPLDWATADLMATVRERFHGVEPSAIDVTPCLYTETPTRDFVIDRHPEWPGLVIAAGFSGRGFKFAPAIGDLLAGLALGDAPPAASRFWLSRWALDRFAASGSDSALQPLDLFHRTPSRRVEGSA